MSKGVCVEHMRIEKIYCTFPFLNLSPLYNILFPVNFRKYLQYDNDLFSGKVPSLKALKCFSSVKLTKNCPA